MLTYSSSYKAKPKVGSELTHFTTTQQAEQPRKTINNTNAPNKVRLSSFRKKLIVKLIPKPMNPTYHNMIQNELAKE